METPEQNEICSKLTIKTPEQRNRHRSSVVIVNFEQISQIALVFLLLTLTIYMPAEYGILQGLVLAYYRNFL